MYKLRGRVPTSLFYEKLNKTRSFLRSSYQSNLIKHAGEVFLFCVMATFQSSKIPRNSLKKKFCA